MLIMLRAVKSYVMIVQFMCFRFSVDRGSLELVLCDVQCMCNGFSVVSRGLLYYAGCALSQKKIKVSIQKRAIRFTSRSHNQGTRMAGRALDSPRKGFIHSMIFPPPPMANEMDAFYSLSL